MIAKYRRCYINQTAVADVQRSLRIRTQQSSLAADPLWLEVITMIIIFIIRTDESDSPLTGQQKGMRRLEQQAET